MNSVDGYLENITDTQRQHYSRIKKIATELAPDAEELISYGMPTLKYKSKPLLYFGAFKDHMSLFPASGSVLEKLDLKNFKTSKGTIQFTESNSLSDAQIKSIIELRIKEIKA